MHAEIVAAGDASEQQQAAVLMSGSTPRDARWGGWLREVIRASCRSASPADR